MNRISITLYNSVPEIFAGVLQAIYIQHKKREHFEANTAKSGSKDITVLQ